jgi:hypothetical protein
MARMAAAILVVVVIMQSPWAISMFGGEGFG